MLTTRPAGSRGPIRQLATRYRDLGCDGQRLGFGHCDRNRGWLGSSFAIADCNKLALSRSVAVCKAPPASPPRPRPASVRLTPRSSDAALRVILDPRRLLRWVLIGRICLASAIFIAAVSNWSSV